MASYLFQQVLSGLFSNLSGNLNALNATTVNATATTTSATPIPAIPADLTGLIALLFSFSALRDWVKLVVIGGIFEACRRLFSSFYSQLTDSFFMNAYFEEEDPSYEWMMAWLSKQPSWAKARDVEVKTDSYGSSSTAVIVDTDETLGELTKATKRLSYLPSISRTYSIWYKRRWMTITRTQQQTGYYGRKEQTLHIRLFTRSTTLLIELLQEARREYLRGQEHSVCVYVSDINNNWRHVACRKKRSLRSVVLEPGVKDLILEDARDFLDSKEWYAERGIPFRRGYLLYGAPGSGKTSLIHCLAGELELDVYVISLSRAGLDDTALDQLVNELPERCIALMEDIDAAFTRGLNREDQNKKPGPGEPEAAQGSPSAPPPTSRLTLSGLLNALDGVSAQEGRILFATTNKYSALDPALCRPGRMDLHIEFHLASKYQARELFTRFYLPGDNPDETYDREPEKVAKVEKESVTDSGYSSSVDQDSSSEKSESTPPTPPAEPEEEIPQPVVIGARHKRYGPSLTRQQVKDLAKQFSDTIPEKEVSMASLQGYLMTYKIRPLEAVKEAQAWVEKERSDRVARQAKEKAEREEAEKKAKEEAEKKAKEEAEKKAKEEEEKKTKEKEEKEKEAKEKDEKDKEKTKESSSTS